MKVWIVSSSRVKDQKYLSLARESAKIFIENNYELICGGVGDSMMKEIVDEYRHQHMPISCVTLECYHENLSKLDHTYIVSSTFDRTKKLYEMADIIIFLPGGTGSLAEIFASLEENRTINNMKPFIIYNYEGFYNPMLKMLQKQVQEGFQDENTLEKLTLVHDLEELKKKVSDNNE